MVAQEIAYSLSLENLGIGKAIFFVYLHKLKTGWNIIPV